MSMSVEHLLGLFDGACGFGQISVLAQDGRAQQQAVHVVIEQQHADRLRYRLRPVITTVLSRSCSHRLACIYFGCENCIKC